MNRINPKATFESAYHTATMGYQLIGFSGNHQPTQKRLIGEHETGSFGVSCDMP